MGIGRSVSQGLAVIQSHCDELGGVDWEWQSADAAMGKARLGGMRSDGIRPTEASREPSAACWWKQAWTH